MRLVRNVEQTALYMRVRQQMVPLARSGREIVKLSKECARMDRWMIHAELSDHHCIRAKRATYLADRGFQHLLDSVVLGLESASFTLPPI